MLECIREFNSLTPTQDIAIHMVAVINSYLGFMSARDTYHIRRDMIDRIDPKWWTYMYVDNHHKKVVLREEYNPIEQIKLKLSKPIK